MRFFQHPAAIVALICSIGAFVAYITFPMVLSVPTEPSRKYVGKIVKYDFVVEAGITGRSDRLKVFTDSGVYLANEKFSPRYGDSVFIEDNGWPYLVFQGGKRIPMDRM